MITDSLGTNKPKLLMLGDHVGAKFDEHEIIVANVRSGHRCVLPKSASNLVKFFITPRTVEEAILNCAQTDEPSESIDLFKLILDLVEMEVLVPASLGSGSDPAPRQLPPGWRAACDFLHATRTAERIEYLTNEELATILAHKSIVGRQPSCFYERPFAPFVALPDPYESLHRDNQGFDYVALLLRRRTSRRYSNKPLTKEDLGKLLFLTWGATALIPNPMGDYFVRKTSPSGGSLHPIEVYPLITNVEGIPSGCYHYSVRRHGLEQVSAESPVNWIAAACGNQDWIAECPVVFATTAFLPRMAWKYDFSRALRVVMADVGHTSQTLNLTATWMGLGCFTTCAMRDETFEKNLGLEPNTEPILMVNGVGHLEEGLSTHDRPRYEGFNDN